jgi:hypothetical protein
MLSYSWDTSATTSRPPGELTLVSVAYRSRSSLGLNWSLTARLNPASAFTWWVVENTDDPAEEKLAPDDGRFRLLPGLPATRTGRTRGSYQHAASLNHVLEQVPSRFLLVLEPDFFLVRPGWISDALDHMQAQGLSFFGAPYFPGRHTKYRYFPCVSCLFVDLQRVDKHDLDFTPEIDEMQAQATRDLFPGNLLRRALVGRALWPFLGTSRDVGYRIYRRFAHDPHHRAGWATPVWREAPGTRTAEASPPARLVQWLDGLLVMPRRGYFSRTGFRELGAWDASGVGWEEYVWRGEPFGFHVQGLSQGLKSAKLLNEAVESFLGRRPATGAPPEAAPAVVAAGQREAIP